MEGEKMRSIRYLFLIEQRDEHELNYLLISTNNSIMTMEKDKRQKGGEKSKTFHEASRYDLMVCRSGTLLYSNAKLNGVFLIKMNLFNRS